jgi:hypothetical protein
VLSGINLGPNLGNGIWHSGTVAAAKQAALMGMPGIALSIPVVKDEPNFDALWRNAGKIEEARGVRRMPESLVPCGFLRLFKELNVLPEAIYESIPGRNARTLADESSNSAVQIQDFLVSCLPRRTPKSVACGTRMAHDEARRAG